MPFLVNKLTADGSSARTPLISVIVPVKKTYAHVEPVLDALLAQDITEPIEIIVSTSEDAAAARFVRTLYPMVRLITGRRDRGPGGNRNRGIEAARGNFLVFIDADSVPGRDWLRRMLSALLRNNGRPVVGWTEVLPLTSRILRSAQIAEMGTAEPSSSRVVPGVTGGNMGVSKALLDAAGARFAEGVYGAEEIVLLHRLSENDAAVLLDPRIRASTRRIPSLKTSLLRHFRLGMGSGELRRTFRMRGSLVARHPLLVPLLVPGRLLLIALRLQWCRRRTAWQFIALSPMILLHLLWYAAGFLDGARRIQKGRRSAPCRDHTVTHP